MLDAQKPRHRNAISVDQNSSINRTLNKQSVNIGAEQLASGCLTPVRSITEIYRSAETRLQKLNSQNEKNNKQEINQRAIVLDDDEDLLAASSDEGTFIIKFL